jgi:glycosyltransferase involved in cell wall biosynthesis
VIRGYTIVFPFVKGVELLAIFPSMSLSTLSKAKIIVVNHDVHGLYEPKASLLWRFLIIMRSGKLLDFPLSRILVVYVSRYSKYSSHIITGSRHVLEKGLVLYPILREYLRASHAKSHNVKEPYKLLIFAKVAKMLNEDFWNVIGRCLEDFVKEGKDFELTIMGGGPADVVEALRTIISKHLSLEILEKTIFRFNVSNEERDRVIEQSDLLIYPPSTEGLRMPVFEAIMRGIPVLSARQTALIELVPSWIYPHREFRYLDFCEALTRAFLDYDKLTHHVKNTKRSVIVTSLANLKRLLRIL